MPSYSGKILRVDLTAGQVTVETPPDQSYRKYMRGKASPSCRSRRLRRQRLGRSWQSIISSSPVPDEALPYGGAALRRMVSCRGNLHHIGTRSH